MWCSVTALPICIVPYIFEENNAGMMRKTDFCYSVREFVLLRQGLSCIMTVHPGGRCLLMKDTLRIEVP